MVGWPWPTSRRRERGEAWWSGKEKISVILPTLNEESSVERSVRSCLGKTKGRGTNVEVVVVDGGSRDDTVRRARRAGARVVSAERGRGLQQDVGSKAASGDLILFLHADSELPEGYDEGDMLSILTDAVGELGLDDDTKGAGGGAGPQAPSPEALQGGEFSGL